MNEKPRHDSIPIKPIPFRVTRRRRHPHAWSVLKWVVWITLGAVFMALVASVGFVFTAKQVSIQTEPEADRVSVHGGLAAPRFKNYYLLRPGIYTVQAEKECYHRLSHEFRVGSEKRQVIRPTLDPLPGRLLVQVHPVSDPATSIRGATVSIDGRIVGVSPLGEMPIAAGRRHVEIVAERFQRFEEDLTISGCNTVQSIAAALIPNWSRLEIVSVPQGADVRIDGEPLGQTPLQLELQAGTYQIELGATGYKPWTSRLTLQPNQPLVMDGIRLQPADATLSVKSTPSGANVMLDMRYVGQTPLQTSISPDTDHVIQVAKPGYESATRTITAAAAQSREINLALQPLQGMVALQVEPADAELLIDGKLWGRAPTKLNLVAVEHELEFRKKGYRSHRIRITPRPGFAQELKVALQKEAAPLPSTRPIIQAKNGCILRLIQPAPFTMGSSRREQGRRSNETLRNITLERPFYFGTKEITNKEFREFLADHDSGSFGARTLNRDDQPVVAVGWEQAALFCNWLSAKESLPPAYIRKKDKIVAVDPPTIGYRLPTEAEWEYCARYDATLGERKYPWGNEYPPPPNSGNFADISAKDLLSVHLKTYNDGYPVSAPPGAFPANEKGLFDLGGNVAEWCHDYYSIYPYDAQKTDVDPTGPPDGNHRVVRGSSWQHASISLLRNAFRDYGNTRRDDVGFRVCRYLTH